MGNAGCEFTQGMNPRYNRVLANCGSAEMGPAQNQVRHQLFVSSSYGFALGIIAIDVNQLRQADWNPGFDSLGTSVILTRSGGRGLPTANKGQSASLAPQVR
jgi:hypothetical protein